MLTAVKGLRLSSWKWLPPPLPGRKSIVMLDRWLTPPANFRHAFGVGWSGGKGGQTSSTFSTFIFRLQSAKCLTTSPHRTLA
jgi:hypothetical protein